MERFVALIVAGGLALVAGLWLATLGGAGSASAVGTVLAVAGVLALAAGIARELDVDAGS